MSYSPNFTGNSATASLAIKDNIQNNTGGTLNAGTPVKLNSSGNLEIINVSVEADVLAIAGLLVNNTPDGEFGDIVSSGRLMNISTSATLGSPVYVSKSGGVTDLKPDIGVGGFISGDWVIALGVIAKNKDNPSDKDIVLNIRIAGQL